MKKNEKPATLSAVQEMNGPAKKKKVVTNAQKLQRSDVHTNSNVWLLKGPIQELRLCQSSYFKATKKFRLISWPRRIVGSPR